MIWFPYYYAGALLPANMMLYRGNPQPGGMRAYQAGGYRPAYPQPGRTPPFPLPIRWTVSPGTAQKHEAPKAASIASPPKSVRTVEKKSGKRHDLNTGDYTSIHLNQQDLEKIVTRLGTNIENIYDLTPGQKWMLRDGAKVTSAFFLQLLLKAEIALEPYTLRKKLEDVFESRDNLRSSYVSRDLSRPYRVVLKNRQAELRFEDLSGLQGGELDEKLEQLMDADRRRGFDLEKDTLLRVAVYRTGEKDTYAIILSQPHINSDGMSMLMLLKELFVDYALEKSGLERQFRAKTPHASYEEYAEWIDSTDREAELAYWRELLRDLRGQTRVPGLLRNAGGSETVSGFSIAFSPETCRGLREKQGIYRVTQNSILQAAWSILLMKMYHTLDVSFGAITSGRDAEVQNSTLLTGGFVNAIPVRAHAAQEDETVSSFAKGLQNQLMTSLSRAHCSPDEIQEALGWKEPVFDHLLNFHNFGSAIATDRFSASAGIPGIRLIDSKLFDNLSANLTVYFRNRGDVLECNFVFNKKKMTDSRIRVLAEQFEKVVVQIAAGDETLTIGEISCPDLHVFDSISKDEKAMREEILSFLEGLGVCDGLDASEIQMLAASSAVTAYLPDDVIIRERSEVRDVCFVYEGTVELCRKSSDGWVHPLMLLKPGKMITASGLWNDTHSQTEARAFGEAKVLSIPSVLIRRLMQRNPAIGVNIMREIDSRAGSFSLLWVNKD